jgi:hypothetical protein
MGSLYLFRPRARPGATDVPVDQVVLGPFPSAAAVMTSTIGDA